MADFLVTFFAGAHRMGSGVYHTPTQGRNFKYTVGGLLQYFARQNGRGLQSQ